MKSSVLGQNYKNNIFVGDYNNNGNLYYFEVSNTRTGIKLDPTEQQVFGLPDLVVDNSNQLSTITFGNIFGGITDTKTGFPTTVQNLGSNIRLLLIKFLQII